MFRNRVLLNWKEPRTAYKEAVKSLTLKDYLKAYGRMIWKWALGAFVVFSLLRWWFPRDGHIVFDFEVFVVVLFVTGSVTALWILSIFINRFDPEVLLREKDILYRSPQGQILFRYRDIENCIVARYDFNEKPIHVLEIRHDERQQSFIEIAPDIAPQAVLDVLREKKVSVTISLLNPLR